MNISAALELLQADEPIVVRDRTFNPLGANEVALDTGEPVYWVRGKDGTWLGIDPGGEEIILFEDLDEAVEAEDDMVVYGGEDYELSYEGVVTVKENDGGTVYNIKDYEGPGGNVVRVIEEDSTGEMSAAYGTKLTEEDLQEA